MDGQHQRDAEQKEVEERYERDILNEIESLTAERDRLREALEKISTKLGPCAGAGALWRQQEALVALGHPRLENVVEY